MTGGAPYYLEKGSLIEAASRIRREIADVESVVRVNHWIIVNLKSTLTKVLILQEQWEEAEELGRGLFQWSSNTLGHRHPDTLGTGSSLALILSKL